MLFSLALWERLQQLQGSNSDVGRGWRRPQIQEHGRTFLSTVRLILAELKFSGTAHWLIWSPETRWQQTQPCVRTGRDVWPKALSQSMLCPYHVHSRHRGTRDKRLSLLWWAPVSSMTGWWAKTCLGVPRMQVWRYCVAYSRHVGTRNLWII